MSGGEARRGAARVGWVLALLTLAFQLALAGRYGFFRDELYFLACGQHLAWGYVDQPPLIAVAARLSQALFGTWLPGIRLLPALCAAGLVLLVARMAAHLGGGRWAAALAGIGAALGPQLVFAGHTLTMNAFEPLLWTAMAFAVLHVVEGGSPRLWLLAGGLAGVGMLNKHSAVFWIGALVAGLLVTRHRRLLWSRWFAAGAALAALVALPHLLWQVANGFPILELLRNGQLRKNAPCRALHLGLPATERNQPAALPQHMADQFGWEEKVAAVERAWRGLPPAERARARVYAQNYGEAAAVDVLGGPRGLPAAASCHNNYWIWSRQGPFPDVWIVLGGRARDHARSFDEVVPVERLAHDPWAMPYEDQLEVFVVRRPRVDLAALFQGCRQLI